MWKVKLVLICTCITCAFIFIFTHSSSLIDANSIPDKMTSVNSTKRIRTAEDITLYKEGVFTPQTSAEGDSGEDAGGSGTGGDGSSNSAETFDPNSQNTESTGNPIPNINPSDNLGAKAFEYAKSQLGVPYVWGGASPSGFDCSGLVLWAYSQVGISLPHKSSDQACLGTAISREDMQVGDVICFGNPVHHVGLYAGNNQYLHAPQQNDVVKISNLTRTDIATIRRVY